MVRICQASQLVCYFPALILCHHMTIAIDSGKIRRIFYTLSRECSLSVHFNQTNTFQSVYENMEIHILNAVIESACNANTFYDWVQACDLYWCDKEEQCNSRCYSIWMERKHVNNLKSHGVTVSDGVTYKLTSTFHVNVDELGRVHLCNEYL